MNSIGFDAEKVCKALSYKRFDTIVVHIAQHTTLTPNCIAFSSTCNAKVLTARVRSRAHVERSQVLGVAVKSDLG